LHDLIPNVVGACSANQTYDQAGNGYQQTANGLLMWRKADNWTAFTNGTRTWVNGPQGIQSRLPGERFAWESAEDDLSSNGVGVTPAEQAYLDDRSNAGAVMTSFVNALNRREYLRAYSYWEPTSTQRPAYTDFKNGYAGTQAVRLTLGSMTGGVAAGNLYAAVPVTFIAQTTGGQTQTFVGCYLLHLGQPAVQGTPPFQPWSIRSANVAQVANDADTATRMSTVCADQAESPLPSQPVTNPNDVSANRYLDDRSNAAELLRSFANALNRREYLRAYSYWRADAAQLQPFEQFQQGYSATQSVQINIGDVVTDAGAGQMYYRVPVVLNALTSTGARQAFVGCYVLHLAQPAIQDTPPYQPLAIDSATVRQVTGTASTQMAQQGCAQDATPPTASLAGTQWKLVSIGTASAVPAAQVTLQLGTDDRASGTAGCNSFGGAYSQNGDKLAFKNLASTLMACTDNTVMKQEQNYLKALNAANQFTLEGDRLTITGSAGTLVFQRANA
jgi:heat shock protein HslJ